MDAHELEELLQDYDDWIARRGIEGADRRLRQRYPEEATATRETYWRAVGDVVRHDSPGLDREDLKGWYLPKPDDRHERWSYAKSMLGLSPVASDRIGATADRILARLSAPWSRDIRSRGLVLGHVQSGKTTSFLSVAAKAADAGYHLVIILAGVHNSLRRQTQNRAARTLVHKRDLWWLGTAVSDFRPDGNSLATHLSGPGKRGLLVVKKHQTILGRLAEWLEDENDASLRDLSILVIDDEADQAGLDVSDGLEPQGIHRELLRIVNLATTSGGHRCAYLAYTATPYANILTSQDHDGLYPRDFIYPLDKPDGYVGAEELFGDLRIGDPIQVGVDDEDDPLLTESLERAVSWFIVATAARAALEGGLDGFHSSMLVHTTQRTEEHLEYRPAIEALLVRSRNAFRQDPGPLGALYDEIRGQVPVGEGALDERAADWDDVRPFVDEVFRRLVERAPAGPEFQEDGRRQQAHSGVIVDNSKVDWIDRLTYSDLSAGEPGVIVIAIGGNTLSRGLTLEGLVCSYFARTARTYDSLIQMGRWFGYRPGYRHLVRIWTPQTLLDWFRELNHVERALRDELTWMSDNGLTPADYGPRIRVSPHMNITRKDAMRSVSRTVSYSDFVLDPSMLDISVDGLRSNAEAIRSLVGALPPTSKPVGPSRVFSGVPSVDVRRLLESYRFHPDDPRIDQPGLLHYVDAETEQGRLEMWNVMFKSIRSGRSEHDFGPPVGIVQRITRSQDADATPGYIGSLVDSGDHRLDRDGVEPSGAARYRSADEPPLLIVYAVDPKSPAQAGRKGSNRIALDAPDIPLALSLALPQSPTTVDYVAPERPRNESGA